MGADHPRRSSLGCKSLLCALFGLFVLGTAGCGDDGDQIKDTDVGITHPTDGRDGGAGDNNWTVTEVEDGAGLEAALDVNSSGEVSVAYFMNRSNDDGTCDELDHTPYPPRLRYDLKLATKTGGGGWQTEIVDSPIHAELPRGLSFKYTPDGDPAIAYTGGEPELDYCGANDAVYTVKSGGAWTTETASANSGESQTGDEASDAGFGVGIHPAMTFDPDGEPAIVHRDEHFVYLQRDDILRADAELAWRSGGSWQHEAVDYGDGAGAENAIMFDGEGRPIVFTSIPVESHGTSRHGVWASRRNQDGTWEQVRIHTGSIGNRISAALDPVFNEPVVAFYSGPDYGVKVKRLMDAEAFTTQSSWASEIVKQSQYDEGDYVSLAFAPNGDPALAYHRCKLYNPDVSECNPSVEAVVFARYTKGAWKYETVREGNDRSCGTYTSLAIAEDGTAHIAFQCTKEFMGEFSLALYVASKRL